jgi:hypothetical protein
MKVVAGVDNVQNAVVIPSDLTVLEDASCSELQSTYLTGGCQCV